ncbi:beta-1,4-N-acetylgalactosaminyltransferase bre-4-like [Anticarsia gemmatalis]|uniref:beta-1,4-N-acetylgalactosaminyltransferase bre-4-like n=1 Tax=Anticarsia gemmatalis TaxID=129554 RepID=UPI003F76BDD1
MTYGEEESSYMWFVSMKHLFKNLGEDEYPMYPNGTPKCQINTTDWGPIQVNKSRLELDWVEAQHPDIRLGGFYAPPHCQSRYKLAILVPYRNREKNLIIFLYYIHRLLKKQLLEYRIFVIEQYGTEKWNKGTLYNIAFLETQRFGTWDCLIFHDVDLIPEDERIMYNCSKNPLHLSSAVEGHGYVLPYRRIFGGVTALTPTQYETVNGYSNFYWNWGGEDDDMFARSLFRVLCNMRYRLEGLKTTKYSLISVSKQKLYTHILADVNPHKMKLDSKTLFNHIIHYNGKELHTRRVARKTFLKIIQL